MPRMTVLLLVSFVLSSSTLAGDPGEFTTTPETSQAPDEVLLRDGTLLQGRILEEHEDIIVFETASLGRVEIPRTSIKTMSRHGEHGGALTDPDVNSIMFCPTADTLEKGDGYFRNYELFFLNFGHAVSDDLNLSLGTLFPFTGDVIMLSAGAKLRLLDRSEHGLGLAATGSYTQLEEVHFGSLGLVAGVGDRYRSLNVSVSRSFEDDGDHATVVMVGGDIQGAGRSKLFAEYMNSATLFAEDVDDLHGFLNVGVRFFGASHSFSISGFRPLSDDSDGLIGLPMIMYSKHF